MARGDHEEEYGSHVVQHGDHRVFLHLLGSFDASYLYRPFLHLDELGNFLARIYPLLWQASLELLGILKWR